MATHPEGEFEFYRVGAPDDDLAQYIRDMEYRQALDSNDDGWADTIEAYATSPATEYLRKASVAARIDAED